MARFKRSVSDMEKQQEFEEAKRVALNGNAYYATSAIESLNKGNRMPDLDFLEKAYVRRRRCIDRIEIVEMQPSLLLQILAAFPCR